MSQYNNVSLLKKGGQKVVYEADDATLGHVILKIGTYASADILKRIQREVLLLRQISSPYYPKNYDFQVITGNRFLIIEEFINAKSLSDHLSEFTDIQKASLLLSRLTEGLNVLWSQRTAHRDIKPDNILILQDKSPKIIDLGIAKIAGETSITPTFWIRGVCTPAYASPEQLKNRKTEIDYRSDQFSLGIVFLQLLMGGRHPFDPTIVGGTSIPENITKGNWAKTKLDGCGHDGIKQIVHRMMAPEPFLRYRNPNDLTASVLACV